MSSFLDTVAELEAQPIGAVATANNDDPFQMMKDGVIMYLTGLKQIADTCDEDPTLKIMINQPINEILNHVDPVLNATEALEFMIRIYHERSEQ